MLVFSSLSPSLTVLANEEVNNSGDYSLYRLSEDFEAEEDFILKEGFVFFGIKDAEFVQVQYKNDFINIELDKIEELGSIENYHFQPFTYQNESSVNINTDQTKIVDSNGELAKIELNKSQDYPTEDDEQIIMGNLIYTIESIVKDKEQSTDEPDQKIDKDESINEESTDSHSKDEKQEVVVEETQEDNSIEENEDEKVNDPEYINNEDLSSAQTEEKREEHTIKATQFRMTNIAADFSKNDRYMEVTEDVNVYIRKNGKLTVVGNLKKGQVYPRYEASPQWHEIQYGGNRAFVKKENTIPAKGNSLKNINNTYKISNYENTFVANSDLEVYDNSTGSLVPFGIIKAGESYTIAKDYGGQWVYVVFADRIGYVKSSNLTINFKPTDRYLRANISSPVYVRINGKLTEVANLTPGEVYPRYEASPKWHEIQYGSGRAFVEKEGTSRVTNASIKNINNQYSIKNYENTFIAQEDIKIYDNSSGSLKQFGIIKKGQEYTIANDYGGQWVYVVFADRIGFIESSKVNIGFKPTDKYFKATNAAPVYLRINGKLTEVANLTPGEVYPRYDASPRWHEIQYGSNRAFVKKEDTTRVSNVRINNINNEYSIRNYENTLVAQEDIVVYDNSSSPMKPFGTIKKGQKYTIAEDYGGNWVYVVLSDRIGFVDASKISKNFNENYSYFRVTTDNLPVYDNRSGSLVEVATLEKGQVFERKPTEGAQWHHINFGNYTAYVKSSETEIANKYQMKGRNEGKYRNSGNTLTTLRDTIVYDNSTGRTIPVGKIKAGQQYPVALDYGSQWIYILVAGKVGLVKLEDVQVGSLITAPELKLYSSYADLINYTQQKGIGTLYYGDTVKVLERRSYAAKVETQSGRIGWIHSEAIDNDLSDNWWFVKDGRNLRASASSSSANIGFVPTNSQVRVLDYKQFNTGTYRHWYKVRTTDNQVGWIWGGGSNGRSVIQYEPAYYNGVTNNINIYTPLNSKTTFTANQLNRFIASKTNSSSYMYGMGDAYIAAQNTTGLNAIYLVAHSALETAFGTSSIVKNNYNYYGIGAFDACPAECANEFQGKQTGIVDGAAWISRNYVHRDAYKQFTLDSMRNNHNTHQYATDEAWHVKISNIARELTDFVTSVFSK